MRVMMAVPALLVLGCSSSTDVGVDLESNTTGLEVSTARTAYNAGDPIDTRIVNHTGEVIFVAHCNFRISLLVERRSHDTWEPYIQVNGAACTGLHPAGDRSIDPGAAVAETFQIDAAGEFRIKLYGRRASEDFGSTVSVSPRFTVSYPPD